MDSYFIRHDACPKCQAKGGDRSGNNLGIFSDHEYCFACGYTKQTGKFPKQLQKHIRKEIQFIDMGRSLGRNGQDFLEQFELSPEEQSFFRWNDEKQQLIFPVYNDNNELIFYQARNFSGSGPKYLTKGNSNGIFKYFYNRGISSTNSDCSVGGDVCVVEDVVSAIKVGRFITAMPLWGSNISIERVRTLSERFKHLMIWLDKDKAEYSLKSRLMASPYFDKVTSLVTELDPKCYNNEQIKEILNV